jgi:hypothetical protein
MEAKDRTRDRVVMTRLLRLNATIYGVVTGSLFGVGMFLATNWLIVRGGRVVGPHLALLGQVFIGYRVTFVGSLVGFAYAFAAGFMLGYTVAWIYNRLIGLRGAGASAPR